MNFKNLILDNTGKSLALYSKKKFDFSKDYIKGLKNFYKKNKKEIRICMHQSKKSNLQVFFTFFGIDSFDSFHQTQSS